MLDFRSGDESSILSGTTKFNKEEAMTIEFTNVHTFPSNAKVTPEELSAMLMEMHTAWESGVPSRPPVTGRTKRSF
jgi:hypothetical protein